jgi:hypothetical protein
MRTRPGFPFRAKICENRAKNRKEKPFFMPSEIIRETAFCVNNCRQNGGKMAEIKKKSKKNRKIVKKGLKKGRTRVN